MVTYNTTTSSFGTTSSTADTQPPEVSAADKAASSVEYRNGMLIRTEKSKAPQVYDARARDLTEIETSANGPTSSPIRFRKSNGVSGTAAQAEAEPHRYLLSIHGRETSLQAALMAGWIMRGADGNYYDARVGGGQQPGKS